MRDVDDRAKAARELYEQGWLTEEEYAESLGLPREDSAQDEIQSRSGRGKYALVIVALAIAVGVVLGMSPLLRTPDSHAGRESLDPVKVEQDREYHRQVMGVLESSAKDLADFNRSGSAGSLPVGLGKLKALALISPPPWHSEAHADLVSTIDDIESSDSNFYDAASSGNPLRVSVSGSSFAVRMEQANAIYKSMEAADAKAGLESVPFPSVPAGSSTTMTAETYRAKVDAIASEANGALGSFASGLQDGDRPAADASLTRLERVFAQSAMVEPPPAFLEAHVSLVTALYWYSEWASEMRTALDSGSTSAAQALAPALDSIGVQFRLALNPISAPEKEAVSQAAADPESEPKPKPAPAPKKVGKGSKLWSQLVHATQHTDYDLSYPGERVLKAAIVSEDYAFGLVEVGGPYPCVMFYQHDPKDAWYATDWKDLGASNVKSSSWAPQIWMPEPMMNALSEAESGWLTKY